MLMARWGSDIILRYVSDAPLANIAREYKAGTAPSKIQDDLVPTNHPIGAAPTATVPCSSTSAPPTILPHSWETAIKANSDLYVNTDCYPRRERYAINPGTAFAHLIAKRKAWERQIHGRTICGQDFRGRGYHVVDVLPSMHKAERCGVEVPVQHCTKCAKAGIWRALLDAPAAESETDSD